MAFTHVFETYLFFAAASRPALGPTQWVPGL